MKNLLENRKPQIKIGIIGARLAGKRTLTAAIIATLFRNSKKKTQPIIVGPGSVISIEFESRFRLYKHVHCRDHQNYLENLIIGGAPKMDSAILVISSGKLQDVRSEAREQIIFARKAGVASSRFF